MSVFTMFGLINLIAMMSLIALASALPVVTVKNHIANSVETRIAAVYFHEGEWHARYLDILRKTTFEIDKAQVLVCWMMEDEFVEYIQTSFEDGQQTAFWRVYYTFSYLETRVSRRQPPTVTTRKFEGQVQREHLDYFCSTRHGLHARDMRRKLPKTWH